MNVREQMLLEYSELSDGVSLAGELCPACEGGQTGEGTLSVSKRQGRLLWYCHRASCSFKGSTGSGSYSAGPRTQSVDVRGVTGRAYVRDSLALPGEVAAQLEHNFGIGAALAARWQLGWNEEEKRVVQPCFDSQGNMVGCVLRSLSGATPKTLTHTEPGAMAWYLRPGQKRVIIVEDQLSAMRASVYMGAVALLGTNLNEDRLYEIKAAGFNHAYLALDRDAYALSVRYATRFRGTLPLRLVQLQRDIKNQTEQELTGLFTCLQ